MQTISVVTVGSANYIDQYFTNLEKTEYRWSFSHCQTGEDALIMMQEKMFDVLLTEDTLEDMPGAIFLESVMRHYPDIIRFIVSDNSSQAIYMRFARYAHQFFVAESLETSLADSIIKSMQLRNLFHDRDLLRFVSSVQKLPALSEVYRALVQELRNPDCSLRKLSDIISNDVGITANILKMVNSSYFGISRKITNLFDAISYLGINIIKVLVVYTDVFSSIDPKVNKLFSMHDFNKHSLLAARLSRELMYNYSSDKEIADKAFVAALLHDIGKLILLQIPDYYYKGSDKIYHTPEQEYENITISHAEIGAYLLRLWNFDDDIVEAVAFHHRPSSIEGKNEVPLLTIMHVAESLIMEDDTTEKVEQFAMCDLSYLVKMDVTKYLPRWQEISQKILSERDT